MLCRYLYWRDTSIQGKRTLLTTVPGARNPCLTSIWETPYHSKREGPQKSLITLGVHLSEWCHFSQHELPHLNQCTALAVIRYTILQRSWLSLFLYIIWLLNNVCSRFWDRIKKFIYLLCLLIVNKPRDNLHSGDTSIQVASSIPTNGEGPNTSSPKNACVGGYYSRDTSLGPEGVPWIKVPL